MKIKPNKKLLKLTPKRFILDKLIPFIMRDAGRGFAMNTWNQKVYYLQYFNGYKFDDIGGRRPPACGTIACIGGSIQCLTGIEIGKNQDPKTIQKMGKLLGLNARQTKALFFGWRYHKEGWPFDYAWRYQQADTPYKKARVACALLKQIAEKGGAALQC